MSGLDERPVLKELPMCSCSDFAWWRVDNLHGNRMMYVNFTVSLATALGKWNVMHNLKYDVFRKARFIRASCCGRLATTKEFKTIMYYFKKENDICLE